MSDADNTSIGESQYHENGDPWNLIQAVGACFFRGNAMKYIARHRRRGGDLDLEKAEHYMAKLSEMWDFHNDPSGRVDAVQSWCDEFLTYVADREMMVAAACGRPSESAEKIHDMRNMIYPKKENSNEH